MLSTRLNDEQVLQEVVIQYFKELVELAPNFFNQLITKPQQTGRLFFDLKINKDIGVSKQDDLNKLFQNGNSVVKDIQLFIDNAIHKVTPVLEIDTIITLQQLAYGCLVHIKNSDQWDQLWARMTHDMIEDQPVQLERMLAGAFAYRLASDVLNLKLPLPGMLTKVKFFTAILNSKYDAKGTLQYLHNLYLNSFVLDALNTIMERINAQIISDDEPGVINSFVLLNSTLHNLPNNSAFQSLGEHKAFAVCEHLKCYVLGLEVLNTNNTKLKATAVTEAKKLLLQAESPDFFLSTEELQTLSGSRSARRSSSSSRLFAMLSPRGGSTSTSSSPTSSQVLVLSDKRVAPLQQGSQVCRSQGK